MVNGQPEDTSGLSPTMICLVQYCDFPKKAKTKQNKTKQNQTPQQQNFKMSQDVRYNIRGIDPLQKKPNACLPKKKEQ